MCQPLARWSRGMILASCARGPGIKSLTGLELCQPKTHHQIAFPPHRALNLNTGVLLTSWSILTTPRNARKTPLTWRRATRHVVISPSQMAGVRFPVWEKLLHFELKLITLVPQVVSLNYSK